MVRSIIGFAILAVLAWIALQLILSVLGFAFALAIKLLIWAVIGFVLYQLLKLVAPDTAQKLSETIRGKKAA